MIHSFWKPSGPRLGLKLEGMGGCSRRALGRRLKDQSRCCNYFAVRNNYRSPLAPRKVVTQTLSLTGLPRPQGFFEADMLHQRSSFGYVPDPPWKPQHSQCLQRVSSACEPWANRQSYLIGHRETIPVNQRRNTRSAFDPCFQHTCSVTAATLLRD